MAELAAATRNRSSASSSSSYNGNGTVGNAVISVDPVTHNLIVIADKQTAEQIRRVVSSLDAPEPQVLIKVVFLEVQHNNVGKIWGVQGSYTGNWRNCRQQTTVWHHQRWLGHTPTITRCTKSFGLPSSLSGASGNGGLYQMLGNDFTATVQAVAAAGKSQVLSRPSILARDGQMAQIVAGQKIYLPSGVTYTSVGTSARTCPRSTAPTRRWASSWMSRRLSAPTAWWK